MKTLKKLTIAYITVWALILVTMVTVTHVENKIEANKEIKSTKNIVAELVNGEHEENEILAYTVREDGKINTLSKYDDKIVVTQDIEGVSYVIELNVNHNKIIDSVLMYMCNYHAFNGSVTSLILI
ncbi:MAG: hypothetical protein ACRCX2_30030 [Paraclostridium sp.]